MSHRIHEEQRGTPRSVLILAWLHLLQSLTLGGYGIFLLANGGWLNSGPELLYQILPLAWFEGAASAVVLFILAVLGVVVAFALMRRYHWSWMAAIILQGLGLLAGLLNYMHGRPNYVGMVIGIFLVFFLNQHQVKLAFRRRDEVRRIESI